MSDTPMPWYEKVMGDALMAVVPVGALEDQFRQHWQGAACPAAMAMFTRQLSRDLHCDVSVFFSPAAADFARTVGAQPCSVPDRSRMNLCVGNAAYWAP